MKRIALLLVTLSVAPARAEPVTIQSGEVALRADFARPASSSSAGSPLAGSASAGIVALHGCSGLFPARDGFWRDQLLAHGHPIVFPDSFTSRGLGSQCRDSSRAVTPGGARRLDTYAAAAWLAAQPGTPPGGVVLVGWSNGGSTVLAAANDPPPGLLRGIVAFYPGCQTWAERANWVPAVPILILMGADDDWTPVEPCKQLAARFPAQIRIVLYPGAYHDFDVPNMPITLRTGLAYTASGLGTAHVGTNSSAQADALRQVPAFVASLPPAVPSTK